MAASRSGQTIAKFMMSDKKIGADDDKKKYRGNLAGFIVQGLFALLHLLIAILTVYYWSTIEEEPPAGHECGLSGIFFAPMHKDWKGDVPKKKGMTIYLVTCILFSIASLIYCVWGMVVKSVFWHGFAYLFNEPFYASILMTVYSWYAEPAIDNGIAWFWTLSLLLSAGHEVMLVLINFVNPKHAYLLPWIRSDAVPDLVI